MTPCDICSRWPSSSRSPGAAARPSSPLRQPPRRAAELVNFQRNGGLAATLDTVTVRADGATRADKRYGGAGRRFDDFRLSAAVMARLRAALERLPARTPAVGDGRRAWAPPISCATAGAPTWPRRARCPPPCAPPSRPCDAIVEGGGRGGPVHYVTQAPA